MWHRLTHYTNYLFSPQIQNRHPAGSPHRPAIASSFNAPLAVVHQRVQLRAPPLQLLEIPVHRRLREARIHVLDNPIKRRHLRRIARLDDRFSRIIAVLLEIVPVQRKRLVSPPFSPHPYPPARPPVSAHYTHCPRRDRALSGSCAAKGFPLLSGSCAYSAIR